MGDPSGQYEFNVIRQTAVPVSLITKHNAVPANELIIHSMSGFSQLLNDPSLVKPVLSLNLVNKLASTVNQIFPFVEYQLHVCETGV